MPERIKHIFSGSRKYYTFFYLIIISIVALGVLSPIMIQRETDNWESELNGITGAIESSVKSIISEKQKTLLEDKKKLKQGITPLLRQIKLTPTPLFELINKPDYSGYSIEVFNSSEELVTWTPEIAVNREDVFPLGYQPGEIHFCRSGLVTNFCIIDTINSGRSTYYYSFSIPVEKHYQIQNNYYRNISLSNELSRKYQTAFEIQYTPASQLTLDGRRESLEIKSNFGNRIGIITFTKPSRENNLSLLRDFYINLQSVLAVLAIVLLAMGFYGKYKKIPHRSVRFLVALLFFAVLRYLLFYLDLPSRFLEGQLTNSSYFASSFGYGIVRSPLEFFITLVLFAIVCINFFEKVYSYIKSQGKPLSKVIYYLLIIPAVFIFLLFLRGLGASLKSIIFDSSLRYFKEPGLLPNLPSTIMQLSFLLLGLSSVLVSIAIVLLLLSKSGKDKTGEKKTLLGLFVFFQLSGILFDLLQSEPQGTPLIRILYITLVFILAYRIYFSEKRSLYNYIYFALISSIITISLLNFYNTELEKESLKTTALDLSRANDDWFEFLIREALFNASLNQETVKALKDQQTNYETAAFAIWAQSSLQREEISSAITFLDRQKAYLGSFGLNIDPKFRINPQVLNYEGSDLQIFNNYTPAALKGKVISGIIPVKEDGVLLGYVVASILYNPGKFRINNFPAFLESKSNTINSAVNYDKLKIFVFIDNVLTNVYGDITPADWHIENILNAGFSENNEAWINLNINNENYITYLLRENDNRSGRIIAVALKEKNLSWSLYNFFKVFFIHSIFIFSFLLVLFAVQLRESRALRYTFRTQLLLAFLFISLLPLLFMAIYNRNLTEEKNREVILLKLKQNALDIESYIKEHLESRPDQNLKFLCNDASRDLNVEFSLFSEKNLYYSSKDEFYRAGLIPLIINPVVFDKLKYQGYKEFVTAENIENFDFNSFYYKTTFGQREFTLKVNDVFNRIPLPVTGEEMDIFLFGSYFFATILVIMISTFMANRISSPIRSLTKATASVAGGDLSFEVPNNEKGEIRDLITGFNSMIKELKHSQSELAELEREIAWKEMARQVAHEIKNPLTPMKLAVQQLIIAYKDKSPKLDMIFEKVSNTIISQIETLNNIASEFSAFARMPNLKLETIELISTVEEACNLFIEENIKTRISKDCDLYYIQADRDHLKRTVINLIRNSIQAGALAIDINIFSSGEKINLEIQDNGKGIPEQNLGRIFETNFTTKAKGMGLGLKMAKKFMENIKGSIFIVETSSSGTKIRLEFPKIINL